MKFESEQKILFVGDSITDAGRRGPGAPLAAAIRTRPSRLMSTGKICAI